MASSKSELGVIKISKTQADNLKRVAVELSHGNMIPLPPAEWEDALTKELGEVYTRSESMHSVGKRFKIEVVPDGDATGIFDPHGNPILLGETQRQEAKEETPVKRKKFGQKLPAYMREG